MSAKPVINNSLPKVPRWLDNQIRKENLDYRYFEKMDEKTEQATIELVVRGVVGGILL